MHTVFDETNPERLTLIDILRWRAQHSPQREAYTFLLDGETKQVQMTYADLDREARCIAALLQDRIAPRERVLLLYPPGLEYIAAIFGCFYAGVVAVPAYPPRPNQSLTRILTILQDAQASAALTTSTLLTALRRTFAKKPFMQDLHCIETDTMTVGVGLTTVLREFRTDPEALALLQYTSGSTGSPKGVMLTHENLIQNAALIQEGMELTSQTRGLFWLPPYHDMGLMGGILQALYTDYSMVLMPPAAFLQQPLRWLQAISSLRITGSGGPNFAYDLCVKSATEETIKTLGLSSWTVALTGAEPVRAETLERFAQTFAPCGFRPEAFYPCYGLAETTLFVSGGQKLDRPRIRTFEREALETGYALETKGDEESSRPLVGCGYAREGQQIAIVDPEHRSRLADGTIGEIWVRGPNVAQGYWGKAQETVETFQAFLRRDGANPWRKAHGLQSLSDEGPFLRTGDLGFCADNELFVTGRLKDLIIIHGRNLYPQDIEQVVEKSHPLLRQNCCAAFAVEGAINEQVVVVQEVVRHYDDQGVQEAIQAICQAILSEFDVEVSAIELLRVGTIPKTSSGKIQRRACRSGFLAGELNAVYRWNRIQESTQGQAQHRSNKEEMPPKRVGTGSAVACGRGQAPTLQAPQVCTIPAAPVRESVAGTRERSGAAGIVPCADPVPTRSYGFTPTVQEIIDWLVMHVAERAHMDARLVDLHAPFIRFGLNSLEAIGLSGELEQWLGRSLSPTLIYDYPSINALAHYLAGTDQPVETNAGADKRHARQTDAIAIIGLGCRFPGADNPAAFWQMLHDGVDAISLVPATRWDTAQFYAPDQTTPGKMNTRWGGFLPDIELFDPAFFHISPREAEVMDPQQRLLLEVAWETFEQAGIVPEKLAGSQTGVFVGISSSDYYAAHYRNRDYHQAYTNTGSAHSIAANRLSYTCDLRGPSMAIDTSCSSSLVAVHQACQSLRYGECDLALAGGVNVILEPSPTIAFSQARTMSSAGRCKAFDEAADGYVRGEGCGLVLLKPLAAAERDGDPVLAIIRGSAVNQDGRSNGLTAPNGPSQEAVIRRALHNAGVSPSEISYVETHGSSTPLGDPIEVDALKAVLMQEQSPDQPCLLGAVKTNIGHLEAAAGIAGLIKTVLCLQKGIIAPNLHFKRLNPHISLAGTTFEIPTKLRQWSGHPHAQRFAGVSAFGFGGTNAHVILEGPPPIEPLPEETETTSRGDSARLLFERSLHLLTISGRTAQALSILAQRYFDFLVTNPTDRREGRGQAPSLHLRDLCHTAQTRRTHFAHRLAISASNTEQLREHLAAFIAGQSPKGIQVGHVLQPPAIAFLFPGQGCQYVNMARQLYETQPTFRAALDECDRLLRPLLPQPVKQESDHSLLSLLYPASSALSPLNETAYAQPALFALAYALAQMWLSWGIKPDVVMGHSVGEYVAACVAGAFSLEDGLKLITARGRLMQALPEHGTMAMVFAEPERVQSFVAPYEAQVSLAALNGPENTVISGRAEEMQLILQRLEAAAVRTHRLPVSHAFHSPLVDPMLDAFEQVAREVAFAPLRLPLVCNLTGQLINAGETLDAHYWRRQTREAVQFATGIQTLAAHGYELFLELGPTPVLSNLGKRCLPENSAIWLSSLRQDHEDWHILMQSIASLYCKGCNLNWSNFDGSSMSHKIALPTYPFEREYCWFKSAETNEGDTGRDQERINRENGNNGLSGTPVSQATLASSTQNEINQWLYQLRWEAIDLPTPLLSIQPDHWLIFLDKKGVGQRLAQQLQEQGQSCSLISPGETIQTIDQHHYQVNPANPQQIKQAVGTALAAVRPSGQARLLPLRGVIHLWSLDTTPAEALNVATLEADQILGVQSALSLIQALVEETIQTRLWLITQGAQPVEATDTDLAVSQAPLWGLGKTCALEHPEIWGGLIDLDPHTGSAQNTQVTEILTVLQGDLHENQIALRGTHAYVARVVRVGVGLALPLQEPRALRQIVSDATYLITGGLWGLGLACARWLAMQGARHLILLGRSKLPPRETWGQVQPESRLGVQIAGLRSLEQIGVQVSYASIDVTDEPQLTGFLEHYQQQEKPPIRGIIHAASVWQDAQGQSLMRPLVNLQAEDLATVLRPKMLGGWLLSRVFQETPLDFFVSFSSAASLLGSVGQSNYAAANEFLDVLAYSQRAHGQPAISIDWGPVSEIGMGTMPEILRVYEYWESYGLKCLSPQQVLAALELLIQEDLARVGVLRLDWQKLEQFSPQMADLPLVSQLVSLSPTSTDREATHNEPRDGNNDGGVGLAPTQVLHILRAGGVELAPSQHRTILSTYVREQIANVLHLPTQRLDPEQALTTLGFDSLMAIELKNRIDHDLQIRLPIAALLQGPSITQLVDQVLTLEGPWGGEVGVEARAYREGACPLAPTIPVWLPLSHNQKALWFLSHLAPESTAYNVLHAARVQQHLDVPALQRALLRLSARYPILTSTYTLQNGEPVQQTHENQILPLEVIDATSRSLDDLKCLLLEESNRPIDLTKGPVLRLQLYQLASDDYLLGFILHHIVADFWALELLIDELSLLYAVEKTGMAEPSRLVGSTQGTTPTAPDQRPSDFQNADYVRWQQAMLESEAGEQHWQYWQNALAGDLPVLNLPTDRPRPPLQTYKGALHRFSLSTDLAERLRTIANEEKVTLFTLMLTTYQVLLHRYTHQNDILIGTPALGRTRSEFERIIGSLVNLVVVRARVGQNPTFKELLQQTKRSLLAALEHQDFPFPLLVERLQLQRDPSYSPLYQTLFTWDRPRRRNGEDQAGHSQALSLSPFAYGQQGAPTDLTLTVLEMEDRLAVDFRYNVDLFDAGTIARMAEHFLTLLDGIPNNLDQHIRELPLLPDNVRQTLLTEWNATHCDYPKAMMLHQFFEQQVERTPDAIAVTFEETHLTYRQLNQHANQLSALLRGSRIGPESLVGLCVERSLEMVIGLLGILKAGGAYVPLDPSYPRERLTWILEDCRPAIILSQGTGLSSSLAEALSASLGSELLPPLRTSVIDLNETWDALSREPTTDPPCEVVPEHLAYLIYTSGSTGKPKGVQVTHANISRLFMTTADQFHFQSSDVWTLFHSLAFDFSVWEIWGALHSGGRLVVVPYWLSRSPDLFWQELLREQVTILSQTPSAFRQLMQVQDGQRSCLRTVVFGGEALSLASLESWVQCYGDEAPQLINMYGITETTVHVTYRRLHEEEIKTGAVGTALSTSPIGQPLSDLELYVLDRQQQLVPIGVAGEVYVAGAGLARGYLNRPDLTAERFVPHPFVSCQPGARLYRSGDLARYRETGELEYLGRIDHQVKLRGFRIELGEIEATLMGHPALQACAALVREDRPEEKRLVAYFVVRQGLVGAGLAPTLRSYLQDRLPAYMLPATFVPLDTLPLTPNGKVDRHALATKALAQDTGPTGNKVVVAPRTRVEKALAAIWTDLLNLEQVGISDNFFEVGGHSLLAVQLLNRVNKQFGLSLSLAMLFQVPTIEQAAALLQKDVIPEEPCTPVAQGTPEELRTPEEPYTPVAQGTQATGASSCIPIQPVGEKRPFFWVHPGYGDVYCYLDLAKYLRHDRPFYGIQAPGLRSQCDCPTGNGAGELAPQVFNSVEEMAASYIDDILVVQPDGPYFLGGYSFGGLVAFEMARQLEARDYSVALLALLDSYPREQDVSPSVGACGGRDLSLPEGSHPASTHPLSTTKGYAEPIVRIIEQLGWKKKVSLSYEELSRLQPNAQLAYVLDRLREAQVVPDDMDISQLRRHIQVYEAHDSHSRNYRPKPYTGRITLFHSEVAEEDPSSWTPFSAEPVVVHTVSGEHNVMVFEPYVTPLAVQLQQCLDEADRT